MIRHHLGSVSHSQPLIWTVEGGHRVCLVYLEALLPRKLKSTLQRLLQPQESFFNLKTALSHNYHCQINESKCFQHVEVKAATQDSGACNVSCTSELHINSVVDFNISRCTNGKNHLHLCNRALLDVAAGA